MSTTTGSPGRITRSPGTWCGLALLGPEPTITNRVSSWVARMAASRSRATSRSLRPAQRRSASPSITLSMAAATRASAWISAASLTMRSERVTVEATVKEAPGSASWRRSRNALQSWSPTASRPRAMPALCRASRTRATGSSVSSQASRSTSRSPRCSLASGASSAGTSSRGVPSAGTTSMVSRSSPGGR